MHKIQPSIAAVAVAVIGLTMPGLPSANAADAAQSPVPSGAIKNVLVIDLENEAYNDTFWPG